MESLTSNYRFESPASLPRKADTGAGERPEDTPYTQGTSISEGIFFFTLNAQKMGPNSPSLVDIVSLLDSHTPDFLLFTETPLLSNNGALTHILRNRGYTIHYHPTNSAPSPPGTIPEARLPVHITRPEGGCRIAYNKHTSWSAQIRPLYIPIRRLPSGYHPCCGTYTLHMRESGRPC